MSKISDAVGNNSFMKVLAYGKSGAGKSTFSSTFPTPIFISDFDGKIASVANYWNAKNKARLGEIDYENYMPTPENGGVKVYRKFLSKLTELEKQVVDGKFTLKTFVVDSLTALADQIMTSIILR